jgi:hypothetical protein
MKKWLVRSIPALVIVIVGVWLWLILFPSPEHVIRKKLDELAQSASFSPNEGSLAKAINSERLTGFFSPDVELTMDVPGHSQQTLHGRDELLQAAMAARGMAGSLSVEFVDINVTIAPDRSSAIVTLTAKGRAGSEKDLLVQELKLTMKRVKRDWLIYQVETVKTLSWERGGSITRTTTRTSRKAPLVNRELNNEMAIPS